MNDENALVDGIKLARRQGLQQIGGSRVAFNDERADRLNLLVAVAERQLLYGSAIEGERRTRYEKGCHEGSPRLLPRAHPRASCRPSMPAHPSSCRCLG